MTGPVRNVQKVQKQQLVQTEGLGRFTRWLFEQSAPFVTGTVWEAGCGIGTYTRHLIAAGCARVIATDYDEDLLVAAREAFAGLDQVRVMRLDLSRGSEFEKLRGERIGTIVCFNVLEHIEDDRMVLRKMREQLTGDGHLVLLVPAHPILFNGIDRSVHHVRRYTASELRRKLTEAGFHVRRLYYFNALALVGWFVYGHVRRRRQVSETPAKFFDRLVPALRWTERFVLRGRVGISLIAIGEPR